MISSIFILYFYGANKNDSEDQYIAFGILNENKMITQYFNNRNNVMNIGENITWYVFIHNNLINDINVLIKVKLLNSSSNSPDAELMVPSEARAVSEHSLLLHYNQTDYVKMTWSIDEIVLLENDSHITELSINQDKIYTDIVSIDQTPFRVVFELYTYSDTVDDFIFGYETKTKSYAPWAQIWFNIN